MKISFFLIVLLILSACRKEEAIWDELDAADRLVIRNRANSKCLAQALDDLTDIITTSNTELTRFARLDTWKLEYLKETAVIETSKIYVWKVSGTTVYFLFSMIEGGVPTNKFIKFNTTTNSEMLADLRKKKCDKSDESLTVSISRQLFTAKIVEARATVDADTYSITTATHTFADELPAFFGYFVKKRVKKSYNDETDVVKTTETFNYKITRITDAVSLSTDFTNDSTFPSKTYCVVDYTAGTPNVYNKPNVANYSLECSTSSTLGPDPDGDTVENFDPITELVI
ncbi:MAG: hypothetical protein H0V66_11120 [Bdellovibrionales bacterium]|nr:hypothetical protein [Bdellovibrionales bacterium]